MLCPSQQEGIGGEQYRIAESTERFIEDQAFLRSSDSAPDPSPVSKLSLFLSLPVSPVELTDGGGGGGGRNHTTARKPGPL